MPQEKIVRLREEASALIDSDPQGALSRYQHLLKIDPADIDASANCASLLMRLGQTEAAAQGYAHVLRLAQLANSVEWASYAQRSLAHLRHVSTTPPTAKLAPEAARNAGVRQTQTRPFAVEISGDDAINQTTDNRSEKPSAVASAIARAALALVAGVGLLLLVATGAVSQLWPYPYVRAALLESIDNLMAGALLGYLGSILLLNAWSRHRIRSTIIYLIAGALFSLALWLTLLGIVQLSGFFSECTNIETIKKACNVQIEEFEKMTPETRKKINTLGL